MNYVGKRVYVKGLRRPIATATATAAAATAAAAAAATIDARQTSIFVPGTEESIRHGRLHGNLV